MADETSRSSVTIRRATPADARAIGAVFDAAVLHGWTHLHRVDQLVRMFPPEFWEETAVGFPPPDALLVAVDTASGELVGYTAVRSATGELFLLFVHPAFSGRGIGRALLDAAHDTLRLAGRQEAFLYTHERNVRALSVYAAAGYRPDGSTRESEVNGELIREVRLVASLTP